MEPGDGPVDEQGAGEPQPAETDAGNLDGTRLGLARQLAPALLILLAFLVVPLLALGRISLLPGDTAFGATGWSFRQYAKVFGDLFYLRVLAETLGYGLVVAGATFVLGFPVAHSLARMRPSARRWRVALIILPLTLSLVVNVFAWLVILGGSGLVNGVLLAMGLVDAPIRLLFNRGAVLVVLIHTFLPFQILSIMSVIAQIDPRLEEAAANLRADRWTIFRRVLLPMALPGIIAGSTLVFILTVSAFVTPRLIGGGRVHMLGSLIYEQVAVVLNWPFGGALSFVLLAIVLTLLGVASRLAGARFFTTRS
ncbi:MAG TPA: ABC transporter permease [Candidatus Methylomirabilis sp.]|nr:ABC transporter permease [Candidatus Methylomirabilis sp.]